MQQFKNIDTWIFDMDHTLYPLDENLIRTYKHKFADHICDVFGMPKEEVEPYLSGLREKYGDARIGLLEERDFDYDGWMGIANRIIRDEITLCQATADFVKNLPGKKVICTNAGDISTHHILETLGMKEAFHHIDDFKSRGYISKPDMQVYTGLIKDLDLDPKRCAFFEDTAINLKPAHDLGMTTVLVHGEIEDRDYIHYAYPSLLDFLKAYN
jgi:putative hydrolase of the HAD superfamily